VPEDRPSASVPVKATVRLAYSLGEIPNAVKTAIAGLFGLYFYTSVMGLSGAWVGVAAVIGLTWDAVIDPFFGHLSDRSRSSFGRRHLFMLVGALTMGVGFWASFSPPSHLSEGWLFVWLLATSFFVRAATSVYRVPYYALGAELSTDYEDRSRITSARSFFSVIGTVAAAALAFVVFFPNRTPGVDPKLVYESYPLMGFAFGVVMTVIALVTTLGTLGAGSPVAAISSRQRTRFAFVRDFISTLENPPLRMPRASSSFSPSP
jgi:GPH family glycoside/pentoside/hexuronide:cation symporter